MSYLKSNYLDIERENPFYGRYSRWRALKAELVKVTVGSVGLCVLPLGFSGYVAIAEASHSHSTHFVLPAMVTPPAHRRDPNHESRYCYF